MGGARPPRQPQLLSLFLLLSTVISLSSACEPACNVPPPTPPSPPPPAPCPPPPSPPPIEYYSPPPPPTPIEYPPPKPPSPHKHTPSAPSGGGGSEGIVGSPGCCVIIPQGVLYPVDPGYKPSGAAKDEMLGRIAAGGAVVAITLGLWGWW